MIFQSLFIRTHYYVLLLLNDRGKVHPGICCHGFFCFVFRYGISYLLCLMRNLTMMLCVRMIWNFFWIGINQGIQCFKICHIFGIRKVTTSFENANNRWLKVKTDIVYLHYYLFIWKTFSDPISKTEIVVKYLHFIFMFICLPT